MVETCNTCDHFKWNGENRSKGNLGYRCDLGMFDVYYCDSPPVPFNCPILEKNRVPWSKTRKDWDDYFMTLAIAAAERSTCKRRQVGAVAVLNRRVLATGYNGAAPGQEHCLDIGCLRDEQNIASGTHHEICRAIHAEQNLIVQAAVHGIVLNGCTVYCTTQPCSICAKLLLGINIERVVYYSGYPDETTVFLLKDKLVKYGEK